MEYNVCFYQNSDTRKVPVLEYIQGLSQRERAKIDAYLCLLRDNDGKLDEPYSRHICQGIRELRIEVARNRHRIFYATIYEKRIILLHAFLKKTPKTPKQEITRALNNYQDCKTTENFVRYEN